MNVCREIILRGSVVLCALAALAAAPSSEPYVTVKPNGNTVQVDVRDDNDKPVPGYRVRLRDSNKKVIAEGQTDDAGRWEHDVPRAGNYDVIWGPKERAWRVKVLEGGPPPTGLSACCLTGPGAERSTGPPPAPRLLGIVFGLFLILVGVSGLVVRASRGQSGPILLILCLLLAASGIGVLVWSGAPARTDPPIAAAQPTGDPNLAEGARADLRKRKVVPLSGALNQLLANPEEWRIKSQLLPLLTKEAPNFELYDHHNHKRSLKELLDKGPVVLVFYYGYFCDHCVSQLFGLQADIKYFHDLGAEVVAISPDTPEITRDRYKEYGAFDFPVLSDPDNKIAEAFGVFVPSESDSEALAAAGASATAIAGAPLASDPLLAASALFPDRPRRERVQYHGTFVIDREGRVQWGYEDNKPFTSNRTLLYKLAELEDKLPAKDN